MVLQFYLLFAGRTKLRVIIDAKSSGITNATRHLEHVILPHGIDVIDDAMQMLHCRSNSSSLEFCVLDFADAYWQIPIAAEEYRHFTVCVQGRYYSIRGGVCHKLHGQVRLFGREWAALGTVGKQHAPTRCFWRKQVDHTLHWLQLLLRELRSCEGCSYAPDVYYGCATDVLIYNRSNRLGGFLAKQGRIIEFFHDAITSQDYEVLQQGPQDSRGQTGIRMPCLASCLAPLAAALVQPVCAPCNTL
eukprot:482122-Amphidinium_carterae.1